VTVHIISETPGIYPRAITLTPIASDTISIFTLFL
jgi:hypothetical protein